MSRVIISLNGTHTIYLEIDHITTHRLFHRQNGKCFYCDKKMKNKTSNDDKSKGFTKDHLFPRSYNNSLDGNKVLSCPKCNREKSDRPPTEAEIAKYLKIYNGIIFRTIMRIAV
jgi:CRISPR/Cas system Type II protein with McrA/HNH and RuvC-like nuclease domain